MTLIGLLWVPPSLHSSLKELWMAGKELWRTSRRGEQLIAPAFRFALLVSLLWMGTLASRADTHYVSLNGTNDVGHSYSNDWSGAATNIQLAVNASIANDTVLVSNGTYNVTNRISIAADITVRSFTEQGHGTNDTIVDGGYSDRTNQCFSMSAGTLDGFTIRNGATTNITAWQGGGGVQIVNNNVKVLNCYIYGNRITNATAADYSGGGGIYISLNLSGVIVSNCTIVSNVAHNSLTGGGIWMYSGLIVASRISENKASGSGGIAENAGTVSNCTVNANLSYTMGGGIGGNPSVFNSVISNNIACNNNGGLSLSSGGRVINSIITCNKAANNGGGVGFGNFGNIAGLSGCQVTANVASNYTGGGVYYDNPYLTFMIISNCIIANNMAPSSANGKGAGLYVYSAGTYTYSNLVQNCLIYGNTGGSYGGGVYINHTGPSPYGLINCTIVSNQAGTRGGGIYALDTTNYIGNCIVYGNVTTGDDNDEIYNNTAANTNNYWYNCTPTNLVAGQGNTTNNPLFVDAGNRNYRLSRGSPCINTGTNMNWMNGTVDLDGRARVRYGRVDMGAYEAIYSGTMYGFR